MQRELPRHEPRLPHVLVSSLNLILLNRSRKTPLVYRALYFPVVRGRHRGGRNFLFLNSLVVDRRPKVLDGASGASVTETSASFVELFSAQSGKASPFWSWACIVSATTVVFI